MLNKREINEFWSSSLGCKYSDFVREDTTVVQKKLSVSSRIITLFRPGRSTVIAVPGNLMQNIKSILHRFPEKDGIAADQLARFMSPTRVDPGIPEHIYYLDSTRFRNFSVSGCSVRILTHDDAKHMERLHDACLEAELDLSEVELDHPVIYGCFKDEKLVSTASYLFKGQDIADIGILTHPDFRGQGLGKTTVSSLCEWGIKNKKIVQYCTQVTNIGSLGIPEALGFELYAIEESLKVVKDEQ